MKAAFMFVFIKTVVVKQMLRTMETIAIPTTFRREGCSVKGNRSYQISWRKDKVSVIKSTTANESAGDCSGVMWIVSLMGVGGDVGKCRDTFITGNFLLATH